MLIVCRSKLTMLVKRMCSYRKGEADACSSLALPCTQHCIRHIMYNVDQLLFEHCTAKFSDNTQCCVPVFDICHELPLCMEHARKRVSHNLYVSLQIKKNKRVVYSENPTTVEIVVMQDCCNMLIPRSNRDLFKDL
jgi:INO80 complex subunit D